MNETKVIKLGVLLCAPDTIVGIASKISFLPFCKVDMDWRMHKPNTDYQSVSLIRIGQFIFLIRIDQSVWGLNDFFKKKIQKYILRINLKSNDLCKN